MKDLSYVTSTMLKSASEADVERVSETYEVRKCDQHEFSSRPNVKIIWFD